MTRLRTLVFYIGAAALALVMVTDFAAVLGRHLGVPLVGAIEAIQAAILVAASAGLVMATMAHAHARVGLLLDRLGPGSRQALARVNAVLAALFFLALAAGSAWIAADLWRGFEESEVLRIDYRPLRIVTILASTAMAVLFLGQAVSARDGASDDQAATGSRPDGES